MASDVGPCGQGVGASRVVHSGRGARTTRSVTAGRSRLSKQFHDSVSGTTQDGTRDDTLFHALGGRPTLERVHKLFYDKLYAHPWLKHFFAGIDQTHIENQQTDFMTHAMGGPDNFMGRMPVAAHQHMFITEELFEERHRQLDESIRACGVADALRRRWLKIDYAFKRKLVKASPQDCVPRWRTEPVVVVEKPR